MSKRKTNNKLTNQLDAIMQNVLYTIKLYNNGDVEIIEGVLRDGNKETFKNCKVVVGPKRVHIINEQEDSVFSMLFMNVIQIICEDMWTKHGNNKKTT